MKSVVELMIVLGCFLAILSCNSRVPTELVLFDFESDSELDRVHWKCHTLLHISGKHPTHGGKSLRMELYPSEYPGFKPFLKTNDWSGYKELCFDVYNMAAQKIKLSTRIDDQKDHTEYEDRYNMSFSLKSGMNHIRIPLDSLLTSGTHRQLDLRRIYRFYIFVVNPPEKVSLHVDYIRLVS